MKYLMSIIMGLFPTLASQEKKYISPVTCKYINEMKKMKPETYQDYVQVGYCIAYNEYFKHCEELTLRFFWMEIYHPIFIKEKFKVKNPPLLGIITGKQFLEDTLPKRYHSINYRVSGICDLLSVVKKGTGKLW